MMNEPEKIFLRRKELISWLGITRQELRKIVDSGKLKPIRFTRRSYAYFSKDHVKDVFGLNKTNKGNQ